MRVLFTSSRGAGHFNPLVPIALACRRSGHEVLVSGPASLAPAAADAGFDFTPFGFPPEDALGATWGRVGTAPREEQNAIVLGEIFGRLNLRAALPALRETVAAWRPDLVIREMNEYAGALAAELYGLPHVRVAVSLTMMEEMGLRYAAAPIDALRRESGLPGDPGADRLRASPYLSAFPASFEDPAALAPPDTRRFHDPGRATGELPAWWEDNARPLVYITFGSVAGRRGGAVFEAALEAVAGLPARVLMTVGHEAPPVGGVPENVHVEPWVPQADVLGHATAVVCHGGSGSTLGALAAGVPLVVVPLFADQPFNAERVEAVGAGLVAPPEPAAIRTALDRVLAESSYARAAGRVAAEMRAHPPADAVVAELTR